MIFKHTQSWAWACFILLISPHLMAKNNVALNDTTRPNILVFMTDDQSYWHTTHNGDPVVKTPHFDRIAKEGVNFTHCFSNAPSCTPSRGACLTGRNVYELEEASILQGAFPKKFKTFQEILWKAGYHAGYIGKAWGPGIWNATDRKMNPGGLPYHIQFEQAPDKGLSKEDYISGFKKFLSERKKGQPFSFFAGIHEPHGPYKRGIGIEHGLDPKKVKLPLFIPDTPGTRSNLCDYLYEIEYADRRLGEMLAILEDMGELNNTLIIVTSDNGMAFPGGKCNLYDQGSRVPLAIRFPGKISSGQTVNQLVTLADLHPTICEFAELPMAEGIVSKSLAPLLQPTKANFERDFIVTAFEVHVQAYPMRALRDHRYLYIRNYEPDRVKVPDVWSKSESSSDQIEALSNTLGHRNYLIQFRKDPKVKPYADRSFGKRPPEELYDLQKDPFSLNNLAHQPEMQKLKTKMGRQLTQHLEKTGDPRHTSAPVLFQSYTPYTSPEYKAQNGDQIKQWKKDQTHLVNKLRNSRGLTP